MRFKIQPLFNNASSVCLRACVHQLCDSVCTVYLLWDVIYTVPVQEKLNEATGYAIRHLLQDVVSQIELHEAFQVPECVLTQVTVTQLRRKSTHCTVCSLIHYITAPVMQSSSYHCSYLNSTLMLTKVHLN